MPSLLSQPTPRNSVKASLGNCRCKCPCCSCLGKSPLTHETKCHLWTLVWVHDGIVNLTTVCQMVNLLCMCIFPVDGWIKGLFEIRRMVNPPRNVVEEEEMPKPSSRRLLPVVTLDPPKFCDPVNPVSQKNCSERPESYGLIFAEYDEFTLHHAFHVCVSCCFS